MTRLLENITLSPMNVLLRLAILQHPNSLPHSLSNLVVHAGFWRGFRLRSTFNSLFYHTSALSEDDASSPGPGYRLKREEAGDGLV